MRRLLAALPLLLLALLGALPATAGAATGPCRPGDPGGPACAVWTGRVTFVDDGDTVDVALAGEGGRTHRVRLTGIQAMEQTVYSSHRARRRGACHAVAATNRLEDLVRASHQRVRLAAQHPGSHSGGRLRRSLAVRRDGRWVDVGPLLAAEGHVLWLPNGDEWAWNREVAAAAEGAADAGLGLWDPTACGAGPSAGADLRVDVNWDADGNDFEDVNGEWVDVTNRADVDVPLDGWWVRDSALRRFTFPAGAVVPAHGRVRVHVGRGRATAGDFYWGLGAPAFENATGGARAMGDGGYLFDPQGDLRASMTYR